MYVHIFSSSNSAHHSRDVDTLHKIIQLRKEIGKLKKKIDYEDKDIDKLFGVEKTVPWADLVKLHIALRIRIHDIDENKKLGLAKKLSFSILPPSNT